MTDPRDMTDEELLAMYQTHGGEAGDDYGDELAAEIDRRNLDI